MVVAMPWRNVGAPADLRLFVGLGTVAAFLLFFLIQGEHFISPFMWGDDLAWEIDRYFYVEKLRQEGRWLVYVWQSLFGIGSAAFDFKLSVLLWCAGSMFLAAMMVGLHRPWLAALTGLVLAINPAFVELLKWPHISVPMMAVLLATVVALAASWRTRWLPAAVFLAAMVNVLSYQMYSLYVVGAVVIALCLRALHSWSRGIVATNDLRRFSASFTLVLLAAATGLATGWLVQYSTNYFAFGLFGFEEVGWRRSIAAWLAPEGASRLDLTIGNADATVDALMRFAGAPTLLVPLVALIAFAFASLGQARLTRVQPLLALLVILGFVAVAVVPFAIPLATEIAVPPDRAVLTLWLAGVGLTLLPAATRPTQPFEVTSGLLLAAALFFGTQTMSLESRNAHEISSFNDRVLDRLEADLRSTLPDGDLRDADVVMLGAPRLFRGPAEGDPLWTERLLRVAFEGRTGTLRVCSARSDCPELWDAAGQQLANQPAFPQSGYIATTDGQWLVKIGEFER